MVSLWKLTNGETMECNVAESQGTKSNAFEFEVEKKTFLNASQSHANLSACIWKLCILFISAAFNLGSLKCPPQNINTHMNMSF